MLITSFVFVMALVVLFAAALLAFHKDYHSGIFGTLGLGLLAVAAFARIAHVLSVGEVQHISSTGVLLWLGLGTFLAHIVVRFLRRVLKHGPTWYDERGAKQRDNHSGATS